MLNRLFGFSLLSLTANVLTKSGVFIVLIYLSHFLTIEDFATYSLIYNLTMVLGTVSAASFGILITNLVSKLNISIIALIKNRLPVSIILSFLSSLVACFFIDLNGISAPYLFVFIFICSLSYSIESMSHGGLNAKLLYKKILFNGFIKVSALILGSVILTQIFGFIGSILALALYVFLGSVLNFFSLLVDNNIKDKYFETKREVISEALPLLLTNIMVTGSMWCLNYYAYDNLGAAESSLLSVLLQITQLILFATTAFTAPLLPFLNRLENKNIELVNLYVPTLIVGVICLFLYEIGFFEVIYGNGIINSSNVELLAYMMMISILSVFKLSLFRKNIQAGKLHLSLINNSIWLLLVFLGIVYFGFEIAVLVQSMLFAHFITLFTSLYMYHTSGVVRAEMFVNIKGLMFMFFIMFCGWVLL
ncbi:hypothetical protein [Pseudoalteromonas sp. MMG005]|uniref:hypothetical protein n=1 Tax=Pseudoalteromonas sp. MMG005 TaxID=2822682 RepID=UPI001B3A041C|nr:hypothetical protein [Pseudoalteromonas sp. MMG005]MBQ4844377.1 hypothetical protein [Pseudoalteromonas sp. MMG005]